ncbi:MAG: hypothetical protein ACO1O6_04225 [Bacteroidota bacterium]
MRTLLFLSLVFILGNSSCKKKELNFILEGKVTDGTFNTSLSGAKVSLEEVLEIGSNDKIVHETTVASDGTYKIEFLRRKATKYILRIEKDKYFAIYKVIPFSDFSTEEPLYIESATTAQSWVRLVFINEPPVNGTDSFRFVKIKGKKDCDECCPETEQIIYGTEPHEFICITDGNTAYSYQYFQTTPPDVGFMEVTTVPFDTVTITKYW